MIPLPRQPRCLIHHVFMASCEQCCQQRKAERDAARRRIQEAAR